MPYPAKRAGAVLRVDLAAIQANYLALQARLGRSQCGAAVKADAYGLGAIPVAKALLAAGCRHFFVAHLDEAITLRAHLPLEAQLYVMHGAPIGYEAEFLEYHCIPVLNSQAQIEAWQHLAQQRMMRLPAVLQVDTGMSRMGLSAHEVACWDADPHFLDGVDLRFIMSHLACAEDQAHPLNALQRARFVQLRARLPGVPASLANSSGIFLGPDYHFDYARPGAALYGVAPVAGQANPMQAVAFLEGVILQLRTIAPGDVVGYGARFTAQRPTRVATVGVGYADGWFRSLSQRGYARIAGLKVPQIGTISMDTLTLDVTDVAEAHLFPGARVDLLSAEETVDTMAALAGTIGYEILTSLGQRYQRYYVGEAEGMCVQER